MNDVFEVPLSRGMVAKIDIADAESVCGFNWSVVEAREKSFYARTSAQRNGKRYFITMHRFILNAPTCGNFWVIHLNGDTLDNRRANLRLVDHSPINPPGVEGVVELLAGNRHRKNGDTACRQKQI